MIIYKHFPEIQAFSFDLDDTLFNNGPIIQKAEQALQAYIAAHYPDLNTLSLQDWQSARNKALSKTPELRSDMGAWRKATLREACDIADVAIKLRASVVRDCFDYFYHQRSNFSVPEASKQVLAQLAEKKPLVAITNGNVNLEQIGIAGYFSVIVKASLDMPMKPHPKMFEFAQQELGIPCRNIMHVGDHLEKDVYGALSAGFSAAWFACNRPMNLAHERLRVLPHVHLSHLSELNDL